MKRFFSVAVVLAAAFVCGPSLYGQPTALAAAVKPAEVPVKAVVLFSSGVGYFEHYGTVQGSGSTELRFKTQQINDILKSLILQDLDGGKVTTITYPSQDPIAKTLRSFQIDITANPSLGELLNQLRGAKVKATIGTDKPQDEVAQSIKPEAGKGGVIQGWAIVENQTDNDWNEVQLSLVNGRPISFIQDLYRPLYVPRPVVQPKLYASLSPQTYEGGMDEKKAIDKFGAVAETPPPAVPGGMPGGGAGAKRQASMEKKLAGVRFNAKQDSILTVEEADRPMDPAASVVSVASAAKAGELFQYTVGSVSLPRQRSAMIPIVTDTIEAEKVSIYNQAVFARNPLNGARLKNTTGKHLLAGPLTVLDSTANATSYAGDASIDDLPPGQERLLSYGIDLQVLVDATKNTSQSLIQTGKIVKGVLTITRKNVFTQDYTAENKGDKDKTLIVEHPLRQGWKLVSADKPIETTETLYRFKGHVAAGKATKLTVQEEVVQGEEVAILPMELGQLEWYSKQGEIPQKVRDVLAKAAAMKGAMAETQRKIAQTQQRLTEITAEQDRLRQNLKTVAANSTYATRLLTKLNDQETQIEKLQGQAEELNQTLQKQTTEFEDFLVNLTVE